MSHSLRKARLVSIGALSLLSLSGCGVVDDLMKGEGADDGTRPTEAAPADTCDAVDASLSEACRSGLEFMQAFISEDNFETFGFDTLPDTDELAFSTPI